MYIRTTNLGTTNSMLNYILSSQSNYYDLVEMASSGKKVEKPSDDAYAATSILNANTKLNQMNSYKTNIDLSQQEINVVDDALSSLTTSLQKVNDLTLQASNGTYTQSDLNSIKMEIDNILNNVVDLSNTQYNGLYVFSGTNTSTKTYTKDTSGNIVYAGTPSTDNYQRYVQIADGVTKVINTPGDTLFGGYDAATKTGSGIFKTLSDISSALATGDTNALNTRLSDLSDDMDNVSLTRTNFGSLTNILTITSNANDTVKTSLTAYKSNLQDADLADVLTKLSAQELTLNATMSVSAKMLSANNLLNYL